MRMRIFAGLLAALVATVALGQPYSIFSPGPPGPVKSNGSYALQQELSADIIGLWTGTCSIDTFLRGDGACAHAITGPAGSDTQVQFNNTGAFGANANFVYLTGSDILQLGAPLIPGTFAVGTCAAMTISGVTLSTPMFCGNSNIQGNLELHSFSTISTNGSTGYGARARGTISAPAAVVSGDNLLTLGGAGFDGTGYTWGAHIHFLADGTPSAGVLPGALDFQTTPAASNTPVSRLLLDHSGGYTVNGSIGTSGQALVSGGPGGAASWATVTATPAGSNTQVQYNASGAFGANSGLTYNSASQNLTVGGFVFGAGASFSSSGNAVGITNTGVGSTGGLVVGASGTNGSAALTFQEGAVSEALLCVAGVASSCLTGSIANSLNLAVPSGQAINFGTSAGNTIGMALAANNGGLTVGAPTGGAKGTGTINMTGCFVNNVACATGSTAAVGPAGAVQYTDGAGNFQGIADLLFTSASDTLTLGGAALSPTITTTATTASGSLTIQPGAVGASSTGQSVTVRGGQGGATAGNGGAVAITGGAANGVGNHLGGNITITAGTSIGTSIGGVATIQGGSSATTVGGSSTVLGGSGVGGGTVNITGGPASAGIGGGINILTGAGSTAGNASGPLSLTTANGNTTGNSGGISIATGSSGGTVGSVTIGTGGTTRVTVAGSDGGVTVGSPTGGDKGTGTVNSQDVFRNGEPIHVAACYVTQSGTTATLNNITGCSSITRSATGTYQLNFVTGTFTSTRPACTFAGYGNNLIYEYLDPSNNTLININSVNSAGALTDGTGYQITCIGF